MDHFEGYFETAKNAGDFEIGHESIRYVHNIRQRDIKYLKICFLCRWCELLTTEIIPPTTVPAQLTLETV
jgi:hypothetical protein